MKWNRIGDDVMCPICAHDGWCMLSDDNKYICCARVKSPIKLGEAGYVHSYKDILKVHPQRTNFDPDYFRRIWLQGTYNLPDYLCHIWDVSLDSIKDYGAMWHEIKRCYLFPMYDYLRRGIGLQERYLTGEKRAVAGSRLGLFIPVFNFRQSKSLIITEGVSDGTTIYDSGHLPVIGRPSCHSGNSHIKDFLHHYLHINNIVIVADNDKVGIAGAQNLQDYLKETNKYLDITILPPPTTYRDVREMKRNNPQSYKKFLEVLKSVSYSN